MYTIEHQALLKACMIVGSQAELARRIGVTPARLNNWLNRDDRVPLEYILAIELATDEKISRYQLVPSFQETSSLNVNDVYKRLSYMEMIMHKKFRKMNDQIHSLNNKINDMEKKQKVSGI